MALSLVARIFGQAWEFSLIRSTMTINIIIHTLWQSLMMAQRSLIMQSELSNHVGVLFNVFINQ